MYSIINRISWLFAITAFIGIFSVDDDLFIFALVVAIIIKVLLNKTFIENGIKSLKEEIWLDVWEKISNLGLDTNDISKIKKTIVTNNESIKSDEFLTTLINKDDDIEEKKLNIDGEEFKKDDFDTSILKNDEQVFENQDNEKISIPEVPSEPSKIELFLKEFFAENVMAKIGGILLALGVIFLMGLVYNWVGPVAKIIIGFALGFGIYITGIIVGTKGYENESMILLGTGILINYIVILSGKFIIGDTNPDGITNPVLTSGLTFGLLVLNTLFSVVTAFLYKSKNLLLFSFVFAYVIPFLTGSSYESFELVGYSLILSLGGFAISDYFYNNDDKASSLQMIFISLIGGNILLLLATLNNSTEFAVKMIGFNIINFLSIFLLYKNNFVKSILTNFIVSYIFLALLMFSGSALTGLSVLVTFIIAVLGLLIINSFFLIVSVGTGLVYMIFLPIFFILGFIFIGEAGSGIVLLPLFLITYLFVFAFGVGNVLATGIKYVFFIVVGFFLFIGNTYVLNNLGIDSITFNTIALTSFVFLLATYILSSRKDLHYLYTVGTVSVIVLLAQIIQIEGDLSLLSIICIVIFGLSNYLLPFINKNLVKYDSQNLILGSVFGIIFMGLYLYKYGSAYFPGVTMGLCFLALAILYFIGGFILFSNVEKIENERKESDLNFIYAFLGIAISLFSISVALVFAKMPAIVAMVWLFQSSIVFFFANKLNKQKIYVAGIILFIVGLGKYGHYFAYLMYDLIKQVPSLNPQEIIEKGFIIKDYFNHLIGNIFIGISIFLNIVIFRKTEFKSTIGVNVLHIVGVIILGLNIVYLFTDYVVKYLVYGNNTGIPMVIIGTLILVLSVIYNLIGNKFTKGFLGIFTCIVLLFHIFSAGEVDNYSLNYVFTIIIGIVYMIDKIAIDSGKINNFNSLFKAFRVVLSIYSFVITSIYLYDATHNYFSLTIYWGVLSLLFVHIGIFNLNKNLRGIGLYILIITLFKIVLYDVWSSIDNGIVRVIAFIFVGGMMIYISSLYKKNGLEIKEDLSVSLDGNNENNNESDNSTSQVNVVKDNSKFSVNKDLDKIDLGDKKSITFIFDDGKKIKIRAKNLVKMGVIISKNAGKNTFKKGELKDTYKLIKDNYKSELSKKDYDKIVEIIESFVDTGGKIEIE